MGSFLVHLCVPSMILVLLVCSSKESHGYSTHSSIPALLVFGDSMVDPGNNNYLSKISRGNFPPYGIDFENHKPTGRFSNGRLTMDWAASHLGIKKYVPPYLDPSLSLKDLMTGVSFASAGSAYDNRTMSNKLAISIWKQVEYFKEYKARLKSSIGLEKTMKIVNNAVYMISCGTNDFIESYPLARNASGYPLYVRGLTNKFIQELTGLGARKMAILGLVPIGCLPITITLDPDSAGLTDSRKCINSVNSASATYNTLLKDLLKTMMQPSSKHRQRQLIYIDAYNPVSNLIHRPKYHGYREVDRGCCGTGLIETGILCNHNIPICKDRNKFVFWDSVHLTERAFYFLFNQSVRPALNTLARTK